MSPNETFNLDGVTATLDEISVDQKHMPLNVIFLQFILVLFLSLVVLCVSFDSENSTNEVLGQFISWRQIYLRTRVFHNLSLKCSLVTLSIGTVGATIVHHPKWRYSTNSSLVRLQVSLKFDSLRMLDFLFDIYHQSSV